jgi:hypothetical protein
MKSYYTDTTNKGLSDLMASMKCAKETSKPFGFLHRKTRFHSFFLAGIIAVMLLSSLVYPVNFALAQSNSWEVQVNFNTTITKNVNGAQITVTESGSGTLQFNVINQQISGTGSDNYVASLSGSFNQEGATQTLSAPPLNVAETYKITGTVAVDGTATLQVTLTNTNAPSTISATVTMTQDGQTLTQTVDIPVELASATSGSFQIKLQDGYTLTVPVSSSGIQGQTTLTVHQGSNSLQSPTSAPYSSSTPSPSQTNVNGASISGISGNVQVTRANTGQVESVSMSTIVHDGDIIKTNANSRVILQLSDGSIISMGPDSQLRLGTTSDNSQPKIIQILYGLFYLKELVQLSHKFNVRTPVCALGARSTEFTVEARQDNNATTVTLIQGEVNVENIETSDSVLLSTGQSLTIYSNSGGIAQQPLSQSVQSVDLSSIDRWWDVPVSQDSGFGNLTVVLAAVAVAIVAVAITAVVFVRRRKRNRAALPFPPPPPPQ